MPWACGEAVVLCAIVKEFKKKGKPMPALRLVLWCSTLLTLACAHPETPRVVAEPGMQATSASPQDLAQLRQYIKSSWQTLKRDNHDLLKAAIDPKRPTSQQRWPVYISAHDDVHAIGAALAQSLDAQQLARLKILRLGAEVPKEHGVLYLPHPYVVPGGRFNEMYGWDSYFIVRGLLADGETTLAQNMTDNLLYEVVHYGSILNANRTYYLTRSQPPFLTRMVLDVFLQTQELAWLSAAMGVVAGALGSSFDQRTDLKTLTHGQRERQRKYTEEGS